MNHVFKHAIFLTALSALTACGGGGSSTPPLVPPVQNTVPVANAGPDQNTNTGAVTTLNAAASSDANGDTLTYLWSISSSPAQSNAELSNNTASMPTFTADLNGTYVFQLIVNDGTVNSAADSINVVATTPNTEPVANAGLNQNINTGAIVTLNGTASSDIDGDSLTYLWVLSVPTGSTASLNDSTLPSPVFTADIDGTYSAQLTVNDGNANSLTASVDIVATTLNSAPVANPGLPQNINTGDLVTLDGSASSDADGDSLSYLWVLDSVPTNSVASLNDASIASPTFTADLEGSYIVKLTVNDGSVDSTGESVTIVATTANSAPMANAGNDQNALVNDIVTLNGSASSDADGDSLTFQWSLLSVPTGSAAVVTNPTASLSSFIPDLAGTYTAQLIVNDGEELSTPDTVNVVVTTPNTPPVANAGPDQSVSTGTLVMLSGSGTDANGDNLRYQWSLSSSPSTSNASLSNSAIATPTFTPDIDGTYVFQLIVNDGFDDSNADSVSFIATTPNVAPIADSGVDQSVNTGSIVSLNGNASSDADNDSLTYSWILTAPNGSSASLNDTTTITPTFTADIEGSYTAQLIVNDGSVDSAPDSSTITATTPNSAPVANAGIDQNINTGALVMLDGTASSDVNGDVLSYQWVLNIPMGSSAILSDNTIPSPTFTADINGTYTAELIVNDGVVNSLMDAVDIVATTLNSAPVANAGPDQNKNTGSSVTLDGSASTDANGDSLSYQWVLVTVPAGSVAALNDASLVSPIFTADIDGSYIAELTVNDGQVSSASDSVSIVASTANSAPVANAGNDQNVVLNSLVTLDGSASSDADSDEITYQWSFTSVPPGNTATLNNDTSSAPSFTPDTEGTYTVQLLVNDGQESSTPDTVNIVVTFTNAAPVANAGSDQFTTTSSIVMLDGSGSTDANNDSLTYTWTFVSVPSGSTAVLDNNQLVNPSFTPDLEGSYVISLIVFDGIENSVADTMQVNVSDITITLMRKIGIFGNNFASVDFPYSSSISLNTDDESEATLNSFRIMAQGGNVTIINLQAVNQTNAVVPRFTTISSGFVLTDGADIQFDLVSPLTNGIPISIRYTFEIAETGQSFSASYLFTTSN